MALIPCSECGTQISSNAESCPFCGNPMKEKDQESATYVHKAVRITCWGYGSPNDIVKKLTPEINFGWEIVSTIKDHLQSRGGKHVYTVVLKRKR